jgi:hypothetical protein
MGFQFSKKDNIEGLPAGIKGSLPKVLNNRVKEFVGFKTALMDGNFIEIRDYCHKQKGVAACYNLFCLEEIIDFIHPFAHSEDAESMKAVLPAFEKYITQIENYL